MRNWKKALSQTILFSVGISVAFVVLLDGGSTAFAKTRSRRKKSTAPPATSSTAMPEYAVPVDQSELHLSSVAPVQSRSLSRSRLEISVSSWAPKNVQTASYVSFQDSYASDRLPYLAVNYIFSPFSGEFGSDLSLKTGFGYLQQGRSQPLINANSGFAFQTGREELDLITLNLGTEWSPSILKWNVFSPYLGIGLLPTLALTRQSTYDAGTSSMSFPVQTSAGLNCDLPWLESWIGISRTSLNLSLVSTFGSISGSDSTDLAGQAGFRLAI